VNSALARGYIASGDFNGNRVPQHIQNQVVKLYCEQNGLVYILSRAEYCMNTSCEAQLWAALKEGYSNIVFYSIWQLPVQASIRASVYKHCINHGIILHFAVERIHTSILQSSYDDIELLVNTFLMIRRRTDNHYLQVLQNILTA